MNNILFEFTFGFFQKIMEFSQIIIDFLFTEIDILGLSISMWALLGSTTLIVILVAWFVKKIVPML